MAASMKPLKHFPVPQIFALHLWSGLPQDQVLNLEKCPSCSVSHQPAVHLACFFAVLHDTVVLSMNRSIRIVKAKMNQGKCALEKSILWKKRKDLTEPLSYTGNLSSLSPTCSLPDRFVCYLSPSAVSNLSRDDALSLAQRISRSCPLNLTHRGITRERAPSSLTTEELQVISCPAPRLSSSFT